MLLAEQTVVVQKGKENSHLQLCQDKRRKALFDFLGDFIFKLPSLLWSYLKETFAIGKVGSAVAIEVWNSWYFKIRINSN